MIVKSVYHDQYIHIANKSSKSYFQQLILHQYGVFIDMPKQNQVQLIQNNLKSLYSKK
jgi:hypothetical protein